MIEQAHHFPHQQHSVRSLEWEMFGTGQSSGLCTHRPSPHPSQCSGGRSQNAAAFSLQPPAFQVQQVTPPLPAHCCGWLARQRHDQIYSGEPFPEHV